MHRETFVGNSTGQYQDQQYWSTTRSTRTTKVWLANLVTGPWTYPSPIPLSSVKQLCREPRLYFYYQVAFLMFFSHSKILSVLDSLSSAFILHHCLPCVCLCICSHIQVYTCHSAQVKVTERLLELSSLFPPHRSQWSNSRPSRPGSKHVYWLSHLVSPVIVNLSKVLLPFIFSWPILTIGKTYPSNKRTKPFKSWRPSLW